MCPILFHIAINCTFWRRHKVCEAEIEQELPQTNLVRKKEQKILVLIRAFLGSEISRLKDQFDM